MTKSPLDLETHVRLRKQLSTISHSSLVDVWKCAPENKKIKTLIRFLKLRFGAGKLSSGEFIQFGLYKPEMTDAQLSAYAGKRAQQAFNKVYNDNTWYAVTKHKMLFETVMKGGGLPIPQTIAIYDGKGRGAGAQLLTDPKQLKAFISNAKNLPLFCKPTTGLLSIGSFRIDKVQKDVLTINGNHEMKSADVCQYMCDLSPKGYLLQKVLTPNKKLEKLNGNSIASVRFVVLNNQKDAAIHSCVLKLPAPKQVADNFWRNGAILCSISMTTHKINRAVINSDNDYQLINKNPETGEKIVGFKLPDFDKAMETVLSAARFLPGIRVQSWDVAFTNSGPVLLEVNYGGDMNLSQLASGEGIMNDTFCQTLWKANYKGKLPA